MVLDEYVVVVLRDMLLGREHVPGRTGIGSRLRRVGSEAAGDVHGTETMRTREGMKRRPTLHARIRFSASRQLLLREQRLVYCVSYRPLSPSVLFQPTVLVVLEHTRAIINATVGRRCVGNTTNDEQYGARHEVRQRARATDAAAPDPPR